MASSKGDFIYKLVPGNPTIPITAGNLSQGFTIPASSLDQKSGFLHMSTTVQIPGTLKRFFASSPSSRDSVYLLRVPYAPLAKRDCVRWESPDAKVSGPRDGDGQYPHIYDEGKFRLTSEEVESVKEMTSEHGEDGWDRALGELKDEGWFV